MAVTKTKKTAESKPDNGAKGKKINGDKEETKTTSVAAVKKASVKASVVNNGEQAVPAKKASTSTAIKKRGAEVTELAPESKSSSTKKAKSATTDSTKSLTAEAGKSKAEAPKPTKKRTADAKEASKQEAANLTTVPSTSRVALAFEALLHHVAEFEKLKKQKLTLPGVSKEGGVVFLQIGLRNMPEQALKTFKGRPISLPFPYRDIDDCSVCMFVKDKPEAKKWLGDDYEKHGIKKIISLQQLRTQYKAFSSRRELADLYDAFVADDRIVCMLPKTLGKAFYVGAKRPLPIRLAKNEKLEGNVTSKIKKALGSAFFYLSGVSTSIRIGTSDMSAEQLVANAEAVLNGAVEHIPGKWKGVQSVFIKSEKSPALPIYEALRPVGDDAE